MEDVAPCCVADVEKLLAIAFDHFPLPTCRSIRLQYPTSHLRCMVLVDFHASLRRKCAVPVRKIQRNRSTSAPTRAIVT